MSLGEAPSRAAAQTPYSAVLLATLALLPTLQRILLAPSSHFPSYAGRCRGLTMLGSGCRRSVVAPAAVWHLLMAAIESSSLPVHQFHWQLVDSTDRLLWLFREFRLLHYRNAG